MKILAYIARHGLKTQVAFARLTGLTPQAINDHVTGRYPVGGKANPDSIDKDWLRTAQHIAEHQLRRLTEQPARRDL